MHFFGFSTILTAFLALQGTSAAPAATCTAAKRLEILNGVPVAFSDPTPGGTYKFLQALPLLDTATLTLYPDGLGPLQVASNAFQVRTFALLVRQVFYYVEGPAKDYGNGRTRSELDITLGALHSVPLPVHFLAGLIFDYDENCMIKDVIGILTIPTSVGGIPIQPIILSGISDFAAQAQGQSAPA